MRDKQAGFTLIEALVALVIAATALVALMGSLGSSADIQRSLSLHELALETAYNKLAEQAMVVRDDEQDGELERAGQQLSWRSWSEETMLDGFKRLNVTVSVQGEPEVNVFIYREMP